MKVHFIAIGGSVMHNLAIALHKKGYQVTGSDDQIFDPAGSRLEQYRLMPASLGWHPERVHRQLDGVILGMHAKDDNPELCKARDLGLKIWSFPEYLYEQTSNKKRVVIGGSHGKTTITSMLMHILKSAGIRFDYMVGAQINGFETMVGLSEDSEMAILEGDEYLSSSLDPTPKFHLYRPHIGVISGISWDHINVFPTFEDYLRQFRIFGEKIEKEGALIYYSPDQHAAAVATNTREDIRKIPYREHPLNPETGNLITPRGEEVAFRLFGNHNAANVQAALEVSRMLGLDDQHFYRAISSFEGASKRLECLGTNEHTAIFLDFAHAPSKLKATINAVKTRFPKRKLVACMELHTFSSLNKDFITQYKDTMKEADIPIVYFNPETLHHKNLEKLNEKDIQSAFDHPKLMVYDDSNRLENDLSDIAMKGNNLLMMTSGNFNGIDLHALAGDILNHQTSQKSF